ncbi:hypothetical protein TNCV_3231391 [Trichonephila clavipes]|nr:hypothetical protein TNCV_3231391 [Trichonephila clavipes]
MSLSRSDCGGCSATFDTPSRTNLRPHTSHPSKGRFLPEGPSGLEEGPTELSNAPSSRHESFVEGLWLTSLKGLYPAEQEDLKVSRRGVRPEWEPPYMDREGAGTHKHRIVQAATPRVLRRKTVAHKPKGVVSCRAGGPKRVVSRQERATVRVDRDYNSFETPLPASLLEDLFLLHNLYRIT